MVYGQLKAGFKKKKNQSLWLEELEESQGSIQLLENRENTEVEPERKIKFCINSAKSLAEF